MKRKIGRRGFSLIEVIVVIAVLGTLAAIAVPRFSGYTDRARVAVDQVSLRNLNGATTVFAAVRQIEQGDIFAGHATDIARVTVLVDDGYLAGAPQPRVPGAEFVWHVDSQKWLYSVHAVVDQSLVRYVFAAMSKSDFTFNTWGGGGGGTWSISEAGLSATGTGNNDMLFIGNDKREYTLTAKFALGNNPGGYGGLGIFFETVLNDASQNRDTGYILQVDRGFSEIVLRKRVNGTESNANGMLLARIGSRSSSTIQNAAIPHKSNTAWWEADKELSLTVKESGTVGVKLLTVVLDGEVLLSDFAIDSDVQAPNNHTGFRAWNNQSATIAELKIE